MHKFDHRSLIYIAIQERVLVRPGKRAIRVRAIEVLLHFLFDVLRRSKVKAFKYWISFSLTYSTVSWIWRVYYNRQVMLTTREHLITSLFWNPCLCFKNISELLMFIMTDGFGLMIRVLWALDFAAVFPICHDTGIMIIKDLFTIEKISSSSGNRIRDRKISRPTLNPLHYRSLFQNIFL